MCGVLESENGTGKRVRAASGCVAKWR